ncbi:hypothetical protein K450DRAFT_224983 [Umbelopsis ramanniana AG]|uniref:Phorbol-ester/DAG-type domain-containing protein n=1 Tax=Umbelopsis ramanniana AG TaxID=1314678 RepID=A0AAD5EFA9_UMBRA|nr:uncharacterized protein K450DRAFT_224983 [Umbelopsis ramanniana AG]KAI8582823.1 hypothetical protein K450DRAFT_224983 [Umbelopsis ramanniana AG]
MSKFGILHKHSPSFSFNTLHSMAYNEGPVRFSNSTVIDMEPVSPQAPGGPFSIHGSLNDLERDENNHRRRSYITPTAAPKLEEYRKIIHHIISKLRKRKRPPPYAEFNSSSQQTVFDNEDVADLLSQLRDVLQICTKAGWTLKTVIDIPRGRGDNHSASSSRSNSPARSPRSASPARSFDGGSPRGANFPLDKSMSNGEIPFIAEILADVVLNDCRYQVAIPKPSRPSYALHSITIDMAILLVQQDTRNLAWLFEIGMIMLPAFDTFPPGPLIGKLLVLYIDWIIPNLIKAHAPTYLFEYNNYIDNEVPTIREPGINVSDVQNAHSGAPTINIQQPERENNSARRNGSGLTIQTSRNVQMRSNHDPTLVRRSSSVSGSHSGDLSIDSYYTYALFSPLLLLMIQNLNPYISAKRSFSLPKAPVDLLRESNTLFHFYQALDFMISQKNDIYLDLLDIISYGNDEVRSRATQILFHYYGRSLGHITVAEPLAKLGHREQMVIAESENREERDREERDRMAVIEAMRAGGTFNMSNLNRKNRMGTSPLGGRDYQETDLKISERVELDEDDENHVFFPHMFPEARQRLSDDIGISMQRSSQGIAMLNIQSTNDDQSSNCRECFKIIKGYGLKCYTCRDGLHYNCYNQKMSTNLLDILHYVNDGGVHKVVSPQYCTIRSIFRKVPAFGSGNVPTKLPAFFRNQTSLDIHGHQFQLVNLFTLTLCLCCRLPLWGISYQGYQCTKCNRFAHLDCLFSNSEQGSNTLFDCRPAAFTEKDISIERRRLEDDFVQNYNDMLIKAENMHNTSFEEVSSLLNILLLQENILHCGTSAGCLVVIESDTNPLATQDIGNGQTGGVNDNRSDELRKAIERCTSYLSNGDPKASTFLNDLSIVNHYHVSDMIFSDDLYLSHIAAMLKAQSNRSHFDGDGNGSTLSSSPRRRSIISSTGYLQVSTNSRNRQVAGGGYDHVEENLTPNEMLHSQSMLEWVQGNLKITSTSLARVFLQHLSDVGLFERLDGMPLVFLESRISRIRSPSSATMDTTSVPCIFTAPFAIDSSPSVESLITAILACLTDMSLSINEYGLLLLTRRCWPDPFTSVYTWERLIYATLKWVYQEDEQLSVIHAEYTAKGQHGAGVSKNRWQVAAQAALMSKNRGGFLTKNRQSVQQQNQQGVGMGTGGVYVSMRNVLRDKYLVGWMSAVYDLNRETFGKIIFEMTKRIVLEKKEEGKFSSPVDHGEVAHNEVLKQDYFLACLLKARSFGILFSSFDTIIESWINAATEAFGSLGLLEMESLSSMKTLQRLCHQKGSSSTGSSDNRLSIYGNSITSDDNGVEGLLGKQLEQPYKLIVGAFDNESFEDFAKGINWIKLLMHSGVGVPVLYLAKIARKLAVAHAPLSLQVDMLKCMWYQSIKGLSIVTSRSAIRDVVGYLNECAIPSLQQMAQQHDITNDDLQNAQDFIKYSAALTCFAYKCPMSNVVELQIVPYVNQHVPTQPERTSLLPDTSSTVGVDNNTVIIKCLLQYLQLDSFNVREELILTFYALSNWGFDLASKSDFLTSCLPMLTPAIWEILSPAYDRMSEISLTFLMKTLTLDVKYFRACVHKMFENESWEIRFQALDNAFGIFTKMDATFQTKWLGMLSHLGPLFSYFVSSIWDSDESVRSKASSYLRALSTLHRRSAFRCWEAYFLNSTTKQKIDLVKIMTQLHAVYPDWQVLEWESLLEALEMEFQADVNDQQYDVLQEYTRPESLFIGSSSTKAVSTGLTPGQSLAEHENLQVLMLTLALQMAGSNLSISLLQLSRFKYCVVKSMGFQNCEKFHTSGTILEVTFANLVFKAEDFSQVSMVLACTRGLKKILDHFTPVNPESIAAIGVDAVDKFKAGLNENINYGDQFVDVVFKMFNSGVDLTQLSHLMLKIWLELILIVVYKHNILERTYENMVISCMKQVIDLLARDISEENKLLILQILHRLHTRSDHLTAMVLSKQIMALGKLMTKHKEDMEDPVLLKAKLFLKSAFTRFATAGLFVLMFKNQAVSDENNQDVDLFFVLRTVIDPGDLVQDEGQIEVIYLRDQPVRDVLEKLMNQQMERRAFSNVLHNVSRYVEVVHSHPYSESVLNDYSVFLTALCKHTIEWRRSEWDINPVLTMSAILLKEHPYDSKTLLLPIRNVFKHALHHCSVSAESIVKLLATYSALATLPGVDPVNIFGQTVLEELKSSFQARSKMSRETVLCMLQVTCCLE